MSIAVGDLLDRLMFAQNGPRVREKAPSGL